MKFRLFFLFMLFISLKLLSVPYDPNIFIYDSGSTEVNSAINEYQNLIEGVPIKGSVMITHDKNIPIDVSSFQIGNKPLKVTFMQSMSMGFGNNLVVTIYSFQVEGMKAGSYTLPPIKVKVGDKYYQAPPLMIQVGSSN